MSRLYRKNFDKVLDQCHVDIPYHDGKKCTMINGMKNSEIRDELWDLYRSKRNTKWVRKTARILRWAKESYNKGSDLETFLFHMLLYAYWGKAEYEWWVDGEKTAWFDPNDKETWRQVLEGCEPLIKLFEELENEKH